MKVELAPVQGAAANSPDVETVPLSRSSDDRVMPHMPVDVRSLSLAVLAVLACLVVLKWAAAVLIPLMLGLMLSYALTPLVDRLERWRLPRSIGAAVVLIGIVGSSGSMGFWLSSDAIAVIEALPDAAQKLRESLRTKSGVSARALDKVQQAAAELEQAAEEDAAAKLTRAKGVTRVQVERPRFDIKEYLWTGTLGLIGVIGQATVVGFIAYFMMASGNTFRRKLVKIAGPTLSEKKITVQALDEITQQIQLYLLVQLFTSMLVGIVTWLAYGALGLEHAAVWGVAAGVLNLVPYLGPIVVTAASAMFALMQFGTLEMAAAISATALLIHLVFGYLLTPWLTGRVGRMNPVVIFVGVLAWGWLWGVWGLLLGIPILMVVKSVCDRIDGLEPVGELLGQ